MMGKEDWWGKGGHGGRGALVHASEEEKQWGRGAGRDISKPSKGNSFSLC